MDAEVSTQIEDESIPTKQTLISKIRRNYHVGHVVTIVHLAIPVIISYVAGIVLGTVDSIFLGHLGSKELAAGSLATSIAFSAYFLIAFGAKNYPLMGTLLQRGFLLGTIAYVPLSIFLFFIEDYLLWVGQEPLFAKMTGNFIRVLIPGYLPFLWHGILNQYLNAQHIMIPNVIVSIIENILNVVFNFLFIYGIPQLGFDGFGYYGSPLATTLSRIFGFFGLLFWIWIRKIHVKTWFGIQIKEVVEWKGIVEFAKIGLPGIFMLNLEAWVYVLGTTIPATFMGEKYIAANSIVLGISTLNFMFPLGLSVAASVLVGNHLGEGNIKAAKTAAMLCSVMAGIGMLLIGLTIAITHRWIGFIFSNDQEIVDLAGTALLVLSFNTIPDGVQGVLSGITRGIGKQVLGASVNFVSYYIFGLPLGILFAFVFHWHIVGLYAGLIVGAITSTIMYSLYLTCILNWNREAKLVRDRVGLEEEKDKNAEDVDYKVKLDAEPDELSEMEVLVDVNSTEMTREIEMHEEQVPNIERSLLQEESQVNKE